MACGGCSCEAAAATAMASEAYLQGEPVREARELVAELCRHFYAQGWVTGTGGSITVKVNDPAVPLADRLIVMSPSGQQGAVQSDVSWYFGIGTSFTCSEGEDGCRRHVCHGCGWKSALSANSKAMAEQASKVYRLCSSVHEGWFVNTLFFLTVSVGSTCFEQSGHLLCFLKAYLMRGAGAVIHSHGMETCIATMLNPGAKEFRVNLLMTHMEMIKGIKGHGYRDELVIPIVENTPYEYELTDSLSDAIAAYPKATAVLVRNHGIYVWGDSWINAKTQAECYHYLLDACIKLYQLGIDWTTPEHGPINSAKRLRSILSPEIPNGCHAAESSKVISFSLIFWECHAPHLLESICIAVDVILLKFCCLNSSVSAVFLLYLLHVFSLWQCVVLDIEGTTTQISFVTDVMFPYARDNVQKHLTSTFDSEETKEDIKLLRIQIEEDLRNGIAGAVPVPPDEAGKEEVINSLVANVESMIKADRKITSLKQLQGHIWRTGFEKKELQGVVFEDVPVALKNWHTSGIKVYIYSSGSREAQRLLFGNTTYGDLRKFLCGYFDTTTGNKRETKSYFEISQSLGVDSPSQILFITDVFQEAVAAKNAGFDVIISIRPGNAPLPDHHGFRTIKSFSEI
ncbi:hypothetical protein HU200_011443 [Digitaria exilis]|uniref:Probable bifunctional methylthioribulose-1-phosphate dehydratase/enolase-phosphatase E1 n=1 Tax=Digitaria exilis TaxID=1010633 RepID=A0A835FGL3_9POAL|nr:hypothetical protein HU200_011443 [Digitaria exilis]